MDRNGAVLKRSRTSSGEASVRRRDDVLMAAIRDAALAELADRGYRGVTFEGVARRAKTSKPVLYRRYRTRAQMVADALPKMPPPRPSTTSTASLRDDLAGLLGSIFSNMRRMGIDTYRSLMAEADDELLDTLADSVAWTERAVHRALSNARNRGEIGPADIPDNVATSILGLVRYEMFFRPNVDEDALIQILDTVYLPLIDAVSNADSERGKQRGKQGRR
jgi:AcrR family transcriptional regulator